MTDHDESTPDMQDLLLQVRTLLMHAVNAAAPLERPPPPMRFGPVEIDLARRVVRRHRVVVSLTPREFALLAVLAQRHGHPVSRDELLQIVWGAQLGDIRAKRRTIDQHICRLRRKLEPLPSHPRYIITVLGSGYRLAGLEGAEVP
ncbi:MAG TPA: helix-turn-helix domain-containing protein [Gemmatimonadaceae bacterium]|nr:helix-turn-helix domain-containing protein [Gemmatimonadaceae bacterium]